ncbi:D-alanyl-D-alanine carboxypeptidase [Oculatella sp. LEGE 06141]|uniref:D-alanyl-D-alanine carboxypeptidase n=1 Tax=Oculatella sp. LEGE 06141 TaxID=1828648 RepID=UPI001D15B62C|nr:D-alanyl-D-alanine carboxypeptidase [Oculatella sp. LEGE 06141]
MKRFGGQRDVLPLLIFSFLAQWLPYPQLQVLHSTELAAWSADSSWIQELGQPQAAPDPEAIAVMQQHLAALNSLGLPQTNNGIWIQSGNLILAENQGTTPLPAASLTKIATTLAALSTWGPDRDFETLVSTTGSIESGVLQGDLVIQSSADPFFVWEEAIALGNALNQAGINQVNGNLVIVGNFVMNFQTEPAIAGELLKQSLNSEQWSPEIQTQYLTLPNGTASPRVVITGSVQTVPTVEAIGKPTTLLVRHTSLQMAEILKAMNIYSNNVMAEMIAQDIGGAKEVSLRAAKAANVPVDEIRLINGSGLGEENQISPRAVCAMLVKIQRYLEPLDMNVADIFPVMGRDRGTLSRRQLPLGAAVKTGTLNAVSSLAGVVPTRDRDLVWFTIINLGNADLDALHDQQDVLLQRLKQQWGDPNPIPPALTPSARAGREANRLGAPSRNEIVKN